MSNSSSSLGGFQNQQHHQSNNDNSKKISMFDDTNDSSSTSISSSFSPVTKLPQLQCHFQDTVGTTARAAGVNGTSNHGGRHHDKSRVLCVRETLSRKKNDDNEEEDDKEAAPHRTLPPARIYIQQQQGQLLVGSSRKNIMMQAPVPAIFGCSMFDTMRHCSSIRSESDHYEKCLVTLSEVLDLDSGLNLVILSDASTDSLMVRPVKQQATTTKGPWTMVPFARPKQTKPSQKLSTTKCHPAAVAAAVVAAAVAAAVDFNRQNFHLITTNDAKRRKQNFVSLSAAALIVDSQNRVLLTRRSRYMRTFPKAWVLPGGGIHSTESILDGLVREIKEETGMSVFAHDIEVVACWESFFPTTAACPSSGQECVGDCGNGILAHYLVVFCKCHLSPKEDVNVVLQKDETDMAVWLSQEQFEMIVQQEVEWRSDTSRGETTVTAIKEGYALTIGNNIARSRNMTSSRAIIPLDDLCGIYPRGDDCCGIAQGSRFMLEQFFQTTKSSFMHQSKI